MFPDDAWHCLQKKENFLILFFAMKLIFFSIFTILMLSLQTDGIRLLGFALIGMEGRLAT